LPGAISINFDESQQEKIRRGQRNLTLLPKIRVHFVAVRG